MSNMVLFSKRILSKIGFWNAQYFKHRNKGNKSSPQQFIMYNLIQFISYILTPLFLCLEYSSFQIPIGLGILFEKSTILLIWCFFFCWKKSFFPHTEGTSLFHDPLPPPMPPHVTFLRTPSPHMGDVLCEWPLVNQLAIMLYIHTDI